MFQSLVCLYDAGYDAVGVEYTSLDQCGGHSNANGAYHYHGVPWCDDFVSETNPQNDQFIGSLNCMLVSLTYFWVSCGSFGRVLDL